MYRDDKAVIGIDIGGTNVKIALLEAKGLNIIESKQYPTEKGAERLKNQLISLVDEMKKEYTSKYSFLGIGVATAGRVDFSKGEILFATENLPGWTGQKLKPFLEERTGLPVIVENDVNAATWGEYIARNKRISDMVCLTLGTGIGAGIIIDNKLVRGRYGRAGEIGHTIIVANGRQCNCGNKGCWEMYASQQGILKTAEKYYSKEELDELTVKEIFDRAKAADPVAEEIIDLTGYFLAIGIQNIIHTIDSPYFVIGGGISRAGSILLEVIEKYLYNDKITWEQIDIELALLGNRAGVIGAAHLLLANSFLKG